MKNYETSQVVDGKWRHWIDGVLQPLPEEPEPIPIDGSLSHTASDYALGYEAGYRDGVVDRGRRFVGKAADTQ